MRKTIVTAACLLLLLPACGDDDSKGSSGDEGEKKTLRVQVSGEPEETAVYRAVAKDFEDENPNVTVELVEIPEKDDHLTRLATDFAGGEPADVFLVNFREYSQFVARGAVEPIQPLLEERDVDLEAYYEPPREAFTYDGALQCMPQNISSLVVYYNRALFQEAGIEEPQEWDWNEFRDVALTLTKGDVRGLGMEPQVIRLAPFIWSNGGEIVDDPDAPTRFTFDDPASREAIEFIVSLVRDDKVVPTEEEIAAQDLETRFSTGKLGMFLSSRRDTPLFRETSSLDFDVAPLPVGKDPAGILHSDGYCIARGSDELEEAADFVQFATGEKGQTVTAFGGRTVPALESIANSGAFLDPSRPPSRSQVFLDGIPHIRRTPVIPTWPEIEDVTEEILTRVFYDPDYTIDKGLEEIEAVTQPLFEEGSSA